MFVYLYDFIILKIYWAGLHPVLLQVLSGFSGEGLKLITTVILINLDP